MRIALLLSLLVATSQGSAPSDKPQSAGDEKVKKPSLSVRASPPISFSPANILVVAELKGGPDDYEDYYCPAIEWDWGDGTRSEAAVDCDPYEAGVSQLTRRFSKSHVYQTQGRFRVQIRLKRSNKIVVAASTNVQVRPGIRDMGPYDGPPMASR